MEYIPQKDSSLMDELATDPSTGRIPVLLCTGSSREVGEVTPRMDKMGVKFISKPFDIEDFLTAIHDLIGQPAEPE
jgi:CheY-like chemotaxis protein